MTLVQMATTLTSDLVAQARAHALLIGLAGLAAGIVAGLVRRSWGFMVLAGGTFFAAVLAVWDYDATGAMLIPLLVFAGGVLVSGFVGWLVHPVGIVGTIGFFAAGWYLILYSLLGPFVMTSIPWDLVLGAIIIGCSELVHRASRELATRRRPLVPYTPQPGWE